MLSLKIKTKMSYSKWNHSKWYTYWHTSSGETINDQVFCICLEAKFKYPQLKYNIDACLAQVDGDAELMGYMLEFIRDVEKEFLK